MKKMDESMQELEVCSLRPWVGSVEPENLKASPHLRARCEWKGLIIT